MPSAEPSDGTKESQYHASRAGFITDSALKMKCDRFSSMLVNQAAGL